MTAYYNEIDPYAARWLRNLIDAGHIAPGDVDERSIVDVRPDDLAGYEQCHFFAGIGGWSYALRLAGWPDDRPVWTGSCPCQPFSAAGQGKAADDERHLWPDWFRLIRDARPPVIFGEQVEAAIGWGWIDLVQTDLGAEGYTTRFAVLPACGVGAPHIRQRLWFVANAIADRLQGQDLPKYRGAGTTSNSTARLVADADRPGRSLERGGGLLDRQRAAQRDDADGCGAGDLADTAIAGRGAQPQRSAREDGRAAPELGRLRDAGGLADGEGEQMGRTGQPWQDCVWLPCTDGKARPVKSGIFPLAHGIPGRMGRLRAAGNAIVPQAAAAFIEACMT